MTSNTDIILDSIADGVFTIDLDWRITSFNKAAERITGIPRSVAIGKFCAEVMRAMVCENACVMKRTMDSGHQVVNEEITIVKPDGEPVVVSVSTALLRDAEGNVIGGVETFRDLSVLKELRRELLGKNRFMDIISKSHLMKRLFDILPEVAESESTVMIGGDSGTGKELFARAIHDLSPRRKERIIAVNCGALPDTLLEAELFGYKAGAFTDAKKDKPGRFALAAGGTIFLDEIGDISQAMQVKLLRVLQEKVYEPLGGTVPVKADVRVITATNKNLDELVKNGEFRRDLFYRINVIRIDIPPLKDRKEDIPLLVDHFICRFNKIRSRNLTGITPGALADIMQHDFPGNVRELENIIEHAFVLCKKGNVGVKHLPSYLRRRSAELESKPEDIDTIERKYILEALKHSDWNRSKAADALDMHKTTLYRKIKKLGIVLPEVDGRSRDD
ncbi:MAG: sigma 54-interacting transcriptional regulator [Candidatus Krumholzibacteria bacterium]|nr:sigma 54-interacting transcriptional regulator [Candidatus Krumholzibacteria bacterium]